MKKIFFILIMAIFCLYACDDNEGVYLDAPENLTATYDGSAINVSWNSVSDAVFYILYYTVDGSSALNRTEPSSSTSYVIENVTAGTTYHFKVRASSNETYSNFTDIVDVTIPVPEEPDINQLPTPDISNIRAGLGWVNFAMTAISEPCDYIVMSGNDIIDATVEMISENSENSTVEYSLSGLKLDTDYSDLKIIRSAEGYQDSEAATFPTFHTGNIKVLTANPSPRHLAFEWDDVAGNGNWTFSTDVDPLTRTYKVELATDAEFTNVIYSFYTVNQMNSTGGYINNNWVGESGTGTSPSKPYANCNTNIALGQLEPATTYYLRVRAAAGESVTDYGKGDGSTIDMNAGCGKSGWSAVVSATTAKAHEKVEGELLYQGFDDHAVQFDQINCAAGVVPAAEIVTYSYPWTGEWGVLSPSTGKRYDELGASYIAPFPGNGADQLETKMANYNFNDDIIPSMNGWSCAKACYPMQGALKLGGSAGQKNYIITPAFTDIEDGTTVTIQCDAGATHATSAAARLNIKVFRAGTKTLEEIKTFDLPASSFVSSPDGTGYHNYVTLETYSTTATLNKGDYVMFESETSKKPALNRLVLDNILIKK